MQSLHHYHLMIYPLTGLSYGYHAVGVWSIYSFIELLHIQAASDHECKVPMKYTTMAQLT